MCRSSYKTLSNYLNDLKVRFNLLPSELADFYFSTCFFQSVSEFVIEEKWLSRNENNLQIPLKFLKRIISDQLNSISSMEEFFIQDDKSLKKYQSKASGLEEKIIREVLKRSPAEKKKFLIHALNLMKLAFIEEESFKQKDINYPRLYRSFDGLDKIFELNYELDINMSIDHGAKERLYQGAGVGVQSGYSSILLALHYLKLNYGKSVIDLGSGYGRVGLVFSLLRPDLDMKSYEYVDHRVQLSKNAVKMLELKNNCHFFTQDLSLLEFKIPLSDVYYLYDPFSKETYEFILKQILEYSIDNQITIVTKGNARKWFKDIVDKKSWRIPIDFDSSNLSIFHLN